MHRTWMLKHQNQIDGSGRIANQIDVHQVTSSRSGLADMATHIEWEPKAVIIISSGTYGFSTNNIDLLIGANCVQALESVDVISSQCGSPDIFRTILGWRIVGPIEDRMGRHGTISCNHVRVVEAGIRGNSIAKHHFEIQNKEMI